MRASAQCPRRGLPARALLLAAAMWGALAAAFPAIPSAQALDGPERALIAEINRIRAERGLDELRYEPRLARVAEALATASANGARGGDPRLAVSERLADSGYAYLAMRAFADAGDLDAVAQARDWLARSDRREALLDNKAVEIGVGHVRPEVPPRAAGNGGGGGADASGDALAAIPGVPSHIWSVLIAAPTGPARAGWGDRVLAYVNKFRASQGLIPLTRNRILDRAAQVHADDMARRDFFAHRTPDGEGPADRADDVGYRWSRVLENLAAGQPSAREAVDGWIASKSGHREAMLDKTVREVGIGYRYLPRDDGRLSVHHYWAMTLAAPR